MNAQTRSNHPPQAPAETPEQPPKPARLLRLPAVTEKTTLSKSKIYGLMKDGKFPRPRALGPGAVAWRESDIDAWIAGLPPTKR